MASRNLQLVLMATIAALVLATATAQSGSSCTSALIGLSPCLNYITGNETTPSSSCCSQLASVVQSEPQCLCTVLDGGASSLGITINQTQALSLPTACNVQTPPASRCNSTGPTASPSTPSSTPGSTTTPSAPSGPSDGGLKKLPGSGSSAGSSIISVSLLLTVSLILVASSST